LRGMGLILQFRTIPAVRGLDDAYDRLPARMDVDMLDCHLLLALAAVAVERFEERRIGAGELVRLGKVFAPAFEGLASALLFRRRHSHEDRAREHERLEFMIMMDDGPNTEALGRLASLDLAGSGLAAACVLPLTRKAGFGLAG
jgi:hypothetical protein